MKTGPAARKEGEIDRIIRAFNAYEGENFARCVEPDGLNWWSVVRYSLAHALCMERGLYGHEEPAAAAIATRGRSLLRQSARLAGDIATLVQAPGRRIGTIYVSTRRLAPVTEGIADSTAPCLVVGGPAIDPGPHSAISKHSIEFFVRLTWRLVRVPRDVRREAERIDGEIRRTFGTGIDSRRIILTKYRRHRAALRAWRFVLWRLRGTRRIVFVNDDTLMGLVHLARRRGIATREVQHAYMGRSHEAFSFPPLSAPLTTLPDEVVVTRDTGDIVYPVPIVAWPKRKDPDTAAVPRDIDVLVGSSPRRGAETEAVLAALAGKGLRIAVKLHPAQSKADVNPGPLSNAGTVEMHAGRADFESLARRSRIYIPVSPGSTTGFEAAENGARVITIDYDGRKLSEMLDGVAAASVEAIDALPAAVDAQLGRVPAS